VSRTLVTFHAHPDDEAIMTAGVMAAAAAEGHRVVLVLATRGELGEVADGLLAPGEELWQRRMVETDRAAAILGVARVVWLGYSDSGMAGEATNHADGSFWAADPVEATTRLAAILAEERADVLTVYDERGVYGHPDHVQVHRVGVRAAELAGTPLVYQATVDRDHVRQVRDDALAGGLWDELPVDDVGDVDLGVPGHEVTTTVDVRPFLAAKRAAMVAHTSQIAETSFFLSLPPPVFEQVFGLEWFIRVGRRPARHEHGLFEAFAERAG
jgi:LmbE family N-acetylglucosaminyl deacetylase